MAKEKDPAPPAPAPSKPADEPKAVPAQPKFRVTVPDHSCPDLIVSAPNEGAAIEAYKQAAGIWNLPAAAVVTPHKD